MAFNVSGLSSYTKEVGFDLIRAAIFNSSSIKDVRKVSGAGSAFKLPKVSNTITLQSGGCNLKTSGTTTMEQLTVTLCDFAYINDLCVHDLRDKYYSEYLPQSMNTTDDLGTYEQTIVDDIAARLSLAAEKIFWEGNTTPTCAGIKQKVMNTAYSATVETVTTTAATSTSNIISVVDQMLVKYTYDSIDEDSILWMSPANYRMLLIAWRNANFYSQADYNNKDGMYIPGSINVKAKPCAGITTNDQMYLTYPQNLVFGSTNEDDYMQLTAPFDEINDIIRMKALWRQAAEIVYPAHLVFFSKT